MYLRFQRHTDGEIENLYDKLTGISNNFQTLKYQRSQNFE